MTKIKSPMLAVEHDPATLKFPCLASFKLDGYRAFVEGGKLLTRNGKPIANEHTQALFGRREFEGLDGELIVGKWNDPKAFGNTTGPMRRAEGTPDVTWYLFDDRSNPDEPFTNRDVEVMERLSRHPMAHNIKRLEQRLIHNIEQLDEFEAEALAAKFEGVMLRSIAGPYKFGRSTVKEGYLLKVKRFTHSEATIIGYEELMHNENEAEEDEMGRTKRSEVASGLVPSGMVGAFIVSAPEWPRPFKISAGSMSHEAKRNALVNFKRDIENQLARYKWFPHGTKDVPRHGLFDELRDPNDMSE